MPSIAQVRLPAPATLRVELLAGLVVALALIPEAISFSIIAGVDPRVGQLALVAHRRDVDRAADGQRRQHDDGHERRGDRRGQPRHDHDE